MREHRCSNEERDTDVFVGVGFLYLLSLYLSISIYLSLFFSAQNILANVLDIGNIVCHVATERAWLGFHVVMQVDLMAFPQLSQDCIQHVF